MTEFVLQIINESGVTEKAPLGWLAKSCAFSVTPPYLPPSRDELITTDTEMYNAAVAFYKLYHKDAYYTITDDQITWELRPGDYVLQVYNKGENKGLLAKHYLIAPDISHITEWDDRDVFVTQDTKVYADAVKFYKSDKAHAKFAIDGDQISWE